MNTKQLIEELQKLDPTGAAEVEIPVYVQTRSHPAAYVAPFDVAMGPWGKMRISCTLPEGMTTVQRKTA